MLLLLETYKRPCLTIRPDLMRLLRWLIVEPRLIPILSASSVEEMLSLLSVALTISLKMEEAVFSLSMGSKKPRLWQIQFNSLTGLPEKGFSTLLMTILKASLCFFSSIKSIMQETNKKVLTKRYFKRLKVLDNSR